ncbi:class I SAM-dependent methyltransferase [Achromobacter arsenitoxydans]|uniref:Type 11 methyltransferase n=1 Tax=Achromobacter arsenitoxydans SY8 TaxID=477184 RepID=H0FB32_9BURK|nr:class I SAM-dependent methyltransferase [Achromobacter arsenitoxydans]EHK64520.1 type 11 methyltransferase [Achromobacter arsenitoxydans SY8]
MTIQVLRVPTVPNCPVDEAGEQSFGLLSLRRNSRLDFVENGEFDPAIAVYDDNYQNSQAHSPKFQDHMRSVLDLLKRQLPAGSKLVEVGCGKGDFLELAIADGHFLAYGYDATYEGSNSRIEKRYLDGTDRIEADLVVLRHVLEHIQRPHEFLELLGKVFGDALVYVEVPSFDWILANQTFFDITYEHVNYFSTTALARLFSGKVRAQGCLFEEQYQYAIASLGEVSPSFGEAYRNESWETMDFDALFPDLTSRIHAISTTLKASSRVFIWGAATKGCMFLMHYLNHGGSRSRVAFAVDINPAKAGKFLPGSLVPIHSPETFFSEVTNDDLLLISNPNYAAEIQQQLTQKGLSGLRVECL